MKTRNGFVSNSSSSSFIVVGQQPPATVLSAKLNKPTAKKVIKSAIKRLSEFTNLLDDNDEDMPRIQAMKNIDVENQTIWLTTFLSDAGLYTDPLEDAECIYYVYTDGGHGGPYDEESFVRIAGDYMQGVWVLKQDFVATDAKKGAQLEFDFGE